MDRGFSEKIIKDFGFGYAPNNKFSLIEKFKSYTSAFLAQAGLVMSIEGKEPYDRFRDRLMLPIQDQRGRVIAFGGRVLVDRNNTPKYLNSPETELFDKGRTLYNFHRASPASKKTKRLIVVEGYMDVIALANSKVKMLLPPWVLPHLPATGYALAYRGHTNNMLRWRSSGSESNHASQRPSITRLAAREILPYCQFTYGI